jgi:hypothetical protein
MSEGDALDVANRATNRWWARPTFAVVGFATAQVLVAVFDWVAGDQPAPTAGALAGKALTGVIMGLVYGFGGNWLVARDRPPEGTDRDEKPGAAPDRRQGGRG